MFKIIKWIVLAVILLLIIGGLIFFFSLNSIVRSTVETQASSSTNLKTTLGGADVSIFGGKVSLSKGEYLVWVQDDGTRVSSYVGQAKAGVPRAFETVRGVVGAARVGIADRGDRPEPERDGGDVLPAEHLLSGMPSRARGPMARGSGRDLWPGFDDLRLRLAAARSRSLRGRALHHGSLLVHGLDVLRQSRCHHRPRTHRQLRGHSAHRRTGFHPGSARRHAVGLGAAASAGARAVEPQK